MGTRQRHFKKKYWIFAERRVRGTRQSILKKNICRVPNSRHSAKKDMAEHRYVGQPMPSAVLLPRAWHSAKKSFAESLFLPSGSAILCRVRHSAKKVFAECPIFDTRQSSLHSANALFPVVSGMKCSTQNNTTKLNTCMTVQCWELGRLLAGYSILIWKIERIALWNWNICFFKKSFLSAFKKAITFFFSCFLFACQVWIPGLVCYIFYPYII